MLGRSTPFKKEYVPPHQLAEEACRVEIDMAGGSVGKQGQYVAAFGGITCFASKAERGISLRTGNGTPPLEPDVIDNPHRTNGLGLQIKEAPEEGDLDRFGELMDVHWQNNKRRSGTISDLRIDRWYEIARDNGALGGKLIGAGGGGFFLFYCPNAHKGQLRRTMTEEGLREMPFDFDLEGAKVLVDF